MEILDIVHKINIHHSFLFEYLKNKFVTSCQSKVMVICTQVKSSKSNIYISDKDINVC